ncbi:MAG: histidinol dehydrogenase [Defluviitaleaceae bacterium]|nr:histidinol dehydrogenase [Defluviitaleaceae bacterium]
MQLSRNWERILSRKADVDAVVAESVSAILRDVKANGDAAVRKYAEKFDGFTEASLEVTPAEIEAAIKAVGTDFIRMLERAKAQITEFHANQKERAWGIYKDNGVMMGQIVRPLASVALYVPGGTAAYPSSVLMNGVPAAIAGVKDIIMLTPAKADGKIPDSILAAAYVAGVTKIYKIGGAHSIAAAAYGTATVPKVQKIVGPGNIYVATAKQLVYGEVDIDMIAGPSEILIIADKTADPAHVAADLMSQAEHDELASSILITTSEQLITATEAELDRQLAYLGRAEIIRKSLEDFGAAVLVKDLDEAFKLSNELAPEHLEILTNDPIAQLPKVQNAGSIFLGAYNPEPLGDYMSGPNHVLPTGGTAKFFSPLGVYDFVKYSSYSYYTKAALAELRDDVITFAESEGLDAHANAVRVRFPK